MREQVQTELISRRVLSEWDSRILGMLRRAAALPGGIAWRVGFRNERGALYRRATIYGVAQLLSVAMQMDAIGFEDELLFEDRQRESCDAIFTPTGRTHGG